MPPLSDHLHCRLRHGCAAAALEAKHAAADAAAKEAVSPEPEPVPAGADKAAAPAADAEELPVQEEVKAAAPEEREALEAAAEEADARAQQADLAAEEAEAAADKAEARARQAEAAAEEAAAAAVQAEAAAEEAEAAAVEAEAAAEQAEADLAEVQARAKQAEAAAEEAEVALAEAVMAAATQGETEAKAALAEEPAVKVAAGAAPAPAAALSGDGLEAANAGTLAPASQNGVSPLAASAAAQPVAEAAAEEQPKAVEEAEATVKAEEAAAAPDAAAAPVAASAAAVKAPKPEHMPIMLATATSNGAVPVLSVSPSKNAAPAPAAASANGAAPTPVVAATNGAAPAPAAAASNGVAPAPLAGAAPLEVELDPAAAQEILAGVNATALQVLAAAEAAVEGGSSAVLASLDLAELANGAAAAAEHGAEDWESEIYDQAAAEGDAGQGAAGELSGRPKVRRCPRGVGPAGRGGCTLPMAGRAGHVPRLRLLTVSAFGGDAWACTRPDWGLAACIRPAAAPCRVPPPAANTFFHQTLFHIFPYAGRRRQGAGHPGGGRARAVWQRARARGACPLRALWIPQVPLLSQVKPENTPPPAWAAGGGWDRAAPLHRWPHLCPLARRPTTQPCSLSRHCCTSSGSVGAALGPAHPWRQSQAG